MMLCALSSVLVSSSCGSDEASQGDGGHAASPGSGADSGTAGAGGDAGAAGSPGGGSAGSAGSSSAPDCKPGAAGAGGIPVGSPGSPGPSCEGATGSECQGASCCDNLLVPAGTFLMGRSLDGSDAYTEGDKNERPEHCATVADFYLDTFEVTVGRFRKFVEHYDGPPEVGAGAHPLIADSGWRSSWSAHMPSTPAGLIEGVKGDIYTPCHFETSHDDEPVNCVSWLYAFAFCAWDGGRLPTEAEWEYAAAGGLEDRRYPWGDDWPNDDLANYNTSTSSTGSDAVGSYPAGAGRWGHLDLAGNMWEWTLDVFAPYTDEACDNCAKLGWAGDRVLRGGGYGSIDQFLRCAGRESSSYVAAWEHAGFRCARDVQ